MYWGCIKNSDYFIFYLYFCKTILINNLKKQTMDNTVKNIFIKMEMRGIGGINYNEVEDVFNHQVGLYLKVKALKKMLRKGNKDKIEEIATISPQCFMKVIKNYTYSPNIAYNDWLDLVFRYSYQGILFGFLTKNGKYKRSRGMGMSFAKQDDKSIINTFVGSRSGKKTSVDELELNAEDKKHAQKDTSLFRKETIGDTLYTAKGNFDFRNLEFFSCDPQTDSAGFNPDEIGRIQEIGARIHPGFVPELCFTTKTDCVNEYPEHGIFFPSDVVIDVMKFGLYRIIDELILVQRNDAHLYTERLLLKPVIRPTINLIADESGWVEIRTKEDVDAFFEGMEIKSFRQIMDYEEAERMRINIEESSKKDRMKSVKTKQKNREKKLNNKKELVEVKEEENVETTEINVG